MVDLVDWVSSRLWMLLRPSIPTPISAQIFGRGAISSTLQQCVRECLSKALRARMTMLLSSVHLHWANKTDHMCLSGLNSSTAPRSLALPRQTQLEHQALSRRSLPRSLQHICFPLPGAAAFSLAPQEHPIINILRLLLSSLTAHQLSLLSQ